MMHGREYRFPDRHMQPVQTRKHAGKNMQPVLRCQPRTQCGRYLKGGENLLPCELILFCKYRKKKHGQKSFYTEIPSLFFPRFGFLASLPQWEGSWQSIMDRNVLE